MKRGEIWWATLRPPTGSEPGRRRPVLIVQSDDFNRSKINTVVVAILTSNLRLQDAPGNAYLSKSEIQLIETEQNLMKQVRETYGNIREAYQRVELAKTRLQDAELTSEISTEKYRLGTATLLEMLDAEMSLVESENEYIHAMYDHKINMANLEKLCGGKL